MALGIIQYGIVHRQEEATTILRPGKNGGPGTEVEVPQELADLHRLVTGDVVEGATLPLLSDEPETRLSDEVMEDEVGWDEQRDEPPAARNAGIPVWLATRQFPTERLISVTRVNGLSLEDAEARPSPRSRRSASERTAPDTFTPLAVEADDFTGRMLDLAAPLGLGCMGIIRGPHGSGLTRTLRAVLNGIVTHAPDCVPFVLLMRARSEEITDWRRRFPQADIVVCASTFDVTTPEQTLRLANLILEVAQRQTELGRDAVLLIDSLTGLWGTMLEAEAADAQSQADRSRARQDMREWVQKAGCFHGEMPLGGALGGSLTLIGTVWDQAIDAEAEEERDLHPHLRLMEHILHETNWRVVLTEILSGQRLYPALDIKECLSLHEERFLPAELLESLRVARGILPRRDPLACYKLLMDALEQSEDPETLLQNLT